MLDLLSAALSDRYSMDREIGRGGMATVWLARDRRLDRLVAIKVLHPDLAGAIGADRFLREIRLTARLQHPHIVPVLDSGVFPGPRGTPVPWFAMMYVPGESLRARLERERHLPVEEAVRIIGSVASALQAAHREGIVHRDIKPENLLLVGEQVYVADFGIAKALMDTGERLTSTGLAIGTPMYMSPEQASAGQVDARTDQYSLASVLYEMLVGEPPFTGPTTQAIVARRMAEPARAIRPVRPTVPTAVEAAVLRALERVPADRFPDITTFADALRGGTAAEAGSSSRAPSRRIVLRVVAGAMVIAALVAAGLVADHRRGPRPLARDSVAVALYRRGLYEYGKLTPQAMGGAVQAFAAAVRRDSTYTEAWAGLAKSYARAYMRRFVFPGVVRDSVLRLAVTAADRSLAGDRKSAVAWKTQGFVSRIVDPTDVSPPIRSLRQSLKLDSTDAEAWNWLAISLAESGDMSGALQAWRRSAAADPAYDEGLAFLSLGHYWRHQYDSAARWADSAIAVEPNSPLARGTAGGVAIERGEFTRAKADFEAARRLITDVELVNALAGSALVEARAGNSRNAREILQRAESLAAAYSPTPLHTAVNIAEAYAGLGDANRAVEWLRRYQPPNDLHFQLHLRCDPPFAPIEADPRFRSLLVSPRPPKPDGC